MHPIKYVWAFRALLYKPFFNHIGNFTYIGKPCFIEGIKKISIGNRVRIFPGVRIETMDQGSLTIGNNVAIEQNVHITCAQNELVIGNDVTILGHTFITNIDHEYEDIDKSALEQGIRVSDTQIGDGCFIGFGAAIQAGTKMGKHCVVGARSVVKGCFPDYCVIVGAPARIIKMWNANTKKWEHVEREDING